MKLKSLLDCMPTKQNVRIVEYGSFKTIYEGNTKNVEGYIDIKHRHVVYIISKTIQDKETYMDFIVIYVSKQIKE